MIDQANGYLAAWKQICNQSFDCNHLDENVYTFLSAQSPDALVSGLFLFGCEPVPITLNKFFPYQIIRLNSRALFI